jgi:hypothetical protein
VNSLSNVGRKGPRQFSVEIIAIIRSIAWYYCYEIMMVSETTTVWDPAFHDETYNISIHLLYA